ncbi:MAG TPA: hypothetical protein VH916_11910 [Dehalococcoidia bacterium]|jgi:hypothetical protein
MPLALVVSGVILFASMFLPLPAAFGIAMALWAHAAGVPLAAVFGLYLLQDVLSYIAVSWLLRAMARRWGRRRSPRGSRLPAGISHRLPRLIPGSLPSAPGLLSVTLLSFYAGAAIAATRRSGALRGAIVVIGVDAVKYANGLAVAVGAVHLLPHAPWTLMIASVAGMAVVLFWRGCAGLSPLVPAYRRLRGDGTGR